MKETTQDISSFQFVASSRPQKAMIAIWVSVSFSLLIGLYWLSAISTGIFTYLFFRLFTEIGDDVPVDTLMLTIAALEWIIGPILAYAGFSNHYKYYMYVPEAEYMRLVVPGIIFFMIGVYAFRTKNRETDVHLILNKIYELLSKETNLPYYLIATGIFFSFIRRFTPASLGFLFFLLSNIKFIGLCYLLFSDRKGKWRIIGAAFILTVISSIQQAMFHDLLLWTVLVGIYGAIAVKISTRLKLAFLIASVFAVFVIQIVKPEYRETVWKGTYTGTRVGLFGSMVEEKVLVEATNPTFIDRAVESIVIRVNQGWIISRIMKMVPAYLPYSHGSTIKEAIFATFVPRFLFSDKPIAGGKKNFYKFTGYMLLGGTSMGISLLGEGYANFGMLGAWVFMLILGMLFSLVLRWWLFLCQSHPTLLLWLPMIFLHLIKAETELVVQLNFLIKSLLVTLLFIWINRKFMGWKF